MLDNSVLCCVCSSLLLSQGSWYTYFTQEQNLICLFLSETKMGRYGAWVKAFCKVILEGCFPCRAASRQPSCLPSMASCLVLCHEKGWTSGRLAGCVCQAAGLPTGVGFWLLETWGSVPLRCTGDTLHPQQESFPCACSEFECWFLRADTLFLSTQELEMLYRNYVCKHNPFQAHFLQKPVKFKYAITHLELKLSEVKTAEETEFLY